MKTTTTAAIAIFLNTWGNYNENGADGGHWVNLPCDLEAELKKLAAATGERPEEMEPFINDYDSEINGLNITEYTDINELNDLAAELETLDEYDREKLAAYIETQGGTIRKAIDNLDRCEYYSGITLDGLAAEFADEMLSGCSDFASRYFDYDAFARDLGFSGYTETENGVIYVG